MNKFLNNPIAQVGLVGASIILSAYLYTRNYRLGRRCKCTKQYYTEDVVIVTGSDSGIGLETAFLVAKRGARVILANADKEASCLAKVQILSRLSPKTADIEALECNFASFRSVRMFVYDVLQYLRDRPGCRITALVNAEEFYPTKRELTVDGYEKTFQINYLSPFLLIFLLLPTMSKSKDRRVVCLSSSVIDCDRDLDLEELNQYVGDRDASDVSNYIFQANRAFQISKQCLALYTSTLKIRAFTSKVNLFQSAPFVDLQRVETGLFCKYYSFVTQKIKRFWMETVNEDCERIMHALLALRKSSCLIKNIDYVDKYLNPLFRDENFKSSLIDKASDWTFALNSVTLEPSKYLFYEYVFVGSQAIMSIIRPSPRTSPTKTVINKQDIETFYLPIDITYSSFIDDNLRKAYGPSISISSMYFPTSEPEFSCKSWCYKNYNKCCC